MRRERAHAPPRIDRVTEVELAVRGADLVGVGRAGVGLRREGRRGKDAVEQPRGDLGRPGEDGAGVVLGSDRECLLGRDRAGVELLHRLVDRDAGLLVPGEDRALDRRGAAPARKQRRVHVEPEGAREQVGRDQEPVGADDHGID